MLAPPHGPLPPWPEQEPEIPPLLLYRPSLHCTTTPRPFPKFGMQAANEQKSAGGLALPM